MASDEQFSLCWNNFHANMSAGFHGLLSRGDLVDVTLAAEGRLLQAHKLVLSVCSPYFQEMFKMNPTQHPIVFLKDVSHSALRDLLQFMYQGEVNVKQEELASFISTAEQLQVKGLTGNQNEESSTPSKPKPTSRPGPRSSQQRQSVMTKLETDLDSKPSSTPVAVKRPNRPSIASNNSSSSQSGPAKRKCVDPLEAGPSGSAKEEFVTIPDEDENNAVAPKMEPEFVNESMWDDDDDGANNEETNFGEDDSNMEMTGFDGSTTGDGNITGGGEGGAVGDAQVKIIQKEPKKVEIVIQKIETLNEFKLQKYKLNKVVETLLPKIETVNEVKQQTDKQNETKKLETPLQKMTTMNEVKKQKDKQKETKKVETLLQKIEKMNKVKQQKDKQKETKKVEMLLQKIETMNEVKQPKDKQNETKSVETLLQKIEPMNEVTQQKDETKIKEKEIQKSAENKQNEATTSRQENKAVYEEPKRNDDEEVEEGLILRTKSGKQMLVVKGNKYFNERERGWKIEWRCSKRCTLGCKANIVTVRDKIVRRNEYHNHSSGPDYMKYGY
ncbi:general transcriptional corepressor trfA-like isoform X3 [Helicoverpa zea]|uniref:general transcriptional corepressor trfA-like isoform X3 n=1 Tax=Helicoverpa zea TaxID=7113 RepID=UPI001F57F979|nr:general transcriptional corepressor trfA-like isoform X3 [Helicoverpa zea]